MSNVDYRRIYEALRGAGLVKTFETASVRFFMGIAATLTKPISGEELFNELDNPEENEKLSEDYKKFLHEVVRPDDTLRYHIVVSDIFVVHYIILLNSGLAGRIKQFPNNDEAVSRMRIMEVPPDADYDTAKVEAVMLIGNGSPNVNDNTRGPLIKHELCHIILKHLLEISDPTVLDYLGELPEDEHPTEEDMEQFMEFLCDFVQFDATIINKYTINPITRFYDAMEFVFKPGTKEKYEKYTKSIAPFFDEQVQPIKTTS